MIETIEFKNWFEIKSDDNCYRYALGTRGDDTLYCIGLNPSYATLNISIPMVLEDDQTIKFVIEMAKREKNDSFIMLNIFPYRTSKPNDLPYEDELNFKEINNNENEIRKIIKNNNVVWLAWGDNIFLRKYLVECKDRIIKIILNEKNGIVFKKMGTSLTNKGNPRHPYPHRKLYKEEEQLTFYNCKSKTGI